MSNVHHEYEPGHRRGYDRNVLINFSTAEYVYMIDHDNSFTPDFFATTIEEYQNVTDQLARSSIISPTIWHAGKERIQSQ